MLSQNKAEIPETILAYVAGVFDGEGSVSVSKAPPNKSHGRKNPHFNLLVAITNCNAEMLLFAQKLFGGNFHARKNIRLGANHVCYAWQLNCWQAHRFLSAIYPYLIAKKRVAELGIQYQENIAIPWDRHKGLAVEEVAKRQWYHDEIKRYNAMD